MTLVDIDTVLRMPSLDDDDDDPMYWISNDFSIDFVFCPKLFSLSLSSDSNTSNLLLR